MKNCTRRHRLHGIMEGKGNEDGGNDVLTRQEVGRFLMNPLLRVPSSLGILEITILAFLRASTGDSLSSSAAFDGHTKWYWLTGTTITRLHLGRYPNTEDSWRLSSLIKYMTGLKRLALWNCNFVPAEIAKLVKLKRLDLNYCDERLKLPRVQMRRLKILVIGGGTSTWDEERVQSVLSWASAYAPRLTQFAFYNHSTETAKVFIKSLLTCEFSIRKTLVNLEIINCGLVEENADDLLLNLAPIFPNLKGLNLRDNSIDLHMIVCKVLKKQRLGRRQSIEYFQS